MNASRNNAGTTRGRPFPAGNSGRPRGARHKVTRAVEELLEGQHQAITQKAIDKALEGDGVALRLCLDRIAPPRKDAPVQSSFRLSVRPKRRCMRLLLCWRPWLPVRSHRMKRLASWRC